MDLHGYKVLKPLVFICLFVVETAISCIAQKTVLHPTQIIYPAAHDLSPPLAQMLVLPPVKGFFEESNEIPNQNYALILNKQNNFLQTSLWRDPVLQTEPGIWAPNSCIVNTDGITNVGGYVPPDPAGDIGANHYIQVVNIQFAIYDKTGVLLYGPAGLGTLWQGFPGAHTNDGDPIVFYDHLADRWIITQFSLPNYPNGPFYELIAVSQTPDPLGAWHRYSYQFSKMPDYPKFGVWPDGYYMSSNLFSSGALNYNGPAVAVFERDSLLAGNTARMTFFELGTDRQSLLPADLDGSLPPAGSPDYFLSANDDPAGTDDHLELFSLHTDWADPANTVFSGPQSISVAAFDGNMCDGSASCIQQAGTSRRLDALSRYLMYRLQYRNFGIYQVLMANHTVDVGGNDHAGIRWYELRTSDTLWTVYQQGTYSPDTNQRWMGSIAMDGLGNIALAYSVSGAGINPSIAATGRRSMDIPGYMSIAEESIKAGAGAQTDASSRWGDYSSLTVDPLDDRTFWYTNEYYAATSKLDWKTRIASFTIDNLPVSIREKPAAEISSAFNLKIYPNPVEILTVISWHLRNTCHCELKIYNAMGIIIKTLVDQDQSPGNQNITIDASDLPSGIYFCQIRTGEEFETKKLAVRK